MIAQSWYCKKCDVITEQVVCASYQGCWCVKCGSQELDYLG